MSHHPQPDHSGLAARGAFGMGAGSARGLLLKQLIAAHY
jgi:hypothetical protein